MQRRQTLLIPALKQKVQATGRWVLLHETVLPLQLQARSIMRLVMAILAEVDLAPATYILCLTGAPMAPSPSAAVAAAAAPAERSIAGPITSIPLQPALPPSRLAERD